MEPLQDTGNDWEEFYTVDQERQPFDWEAIQAQVVPEWTHVERPLTDIMRRLIQRNRY